MAESKLTGFTPEEIEHCKASMSKPAPMEALALIASGRVVIELSRDRRNVSIIELDGRRLKDPDHPEDMSRTLGLSGAWPLYRAGMINEYGVVTEAGRAALQLQGGSEQ